MLLVLGIAILGLASGCSQSSSSQTSDPATMIDSGSWYVREQWPHDGNTYESQHFVVYSDAASQKARQSVAEIGEDLLAELITEFGIVPDEMLHFPDGQDKIHIYVYKNHYPQAWGARAYYGGLIIWSLDHKKRDTNLDIYAPVAKHELVHVVENLLRGRKPTESPRTEAWFSEGLAEAITGGTSGGAIRDIGYMNYLTEEHGKLSPITYKQDWDWGPRAGFEYWYPMSQLAVEYLLDADGLGRSPQDVTHMFTDMAAGVSFATAFETHMGIGVKDYEEQFFDRMEAYLDEDVTVISIKRIMLAWLILTVGSLIVLPRYLAHATGTHWGIRATCVPVTVVFGPLGLLSYIRSYRRSGPELSIWTRALGTSLYSMAGSVTGLALVFSYSRYHSPNWDIGPIFFIAPLLVGWLAFRAPLVSVQSDISYWRAVRRTLLDALVLTILALIGMLLVLSTLCNRWYFAENAGSPFFWGLFPLGAIAGVAILYPYNLWMARRDPARWPGAIVESEAM